MWRRFLILSGRRFDSPNRDEQQKMLFSFIDQPAHDYYDDDDYPKEEEEERHDQGSGGGIVVPIPVETRSQRHLEIQQEHTIVAAVTHVRSRQGVENVVRYPGRIRLVIGGGGDGVMKSRTMEDAKCRARRYKEWEKKGG